MPAHTFLKSIDPLSAPAVVFGALSVCVGVLQHQVSDWRWAFAIGPGLAIIALALLLAWMNRREARVRR